MSIYRDTELNFLYKYKEIYVMFFTFFMKMQLSLKFYFENGKCVFQ